MRCSLLLTDRSWAPRRLAGALLALGALATAGTASAGSGEPVPGPTPGPSSSVSPPPQEQWSDSVGLSAASVCASGDGWLARLVITWSTDNPAEPSTSFGLFGAPGMNPRYADWNGEPASGSTTYDFPFSATTDLMVNMVWGMAVGNEQAFLTVSPAQQGDCGDAEEEEEATTTAVVSPSSTPSGGGSSTGGSSNQGSSSSTAARLPRTGGSTGVLVGVAGLVAVAGIALLGLARRRPTT